MSEPRKQLHAVAGERSTRGERTAHRLPSWRWYLAGGLLLINAVLAIHYPIAKFILFDLGTAACVLAVALGPRRRRAQGVRYWTLFAVAGTLQLAGGVVIQVYQLLGEQVPHPSPADLFFLLSYPCFIVGAVGFVRLRAPGRDWESLLDASIVAVLVCVVSWLLAAQTGMPHGVFAGVVALAYPALDALLVGVVARLLFGLGRPSVSVRFLMGSVAMLLVCDVLYTSKVLSSVYALGGLSDGGYLLSIIFLAIAAMHPSASTVTARGEPGSRSILRRFVFIGGAAVTGPFVLAGFADDFGPTRITVIAAASGIVTVLVALRWVCSALERDKDVDREAALRRCASSFVGASDVRSIGGAVLNAVAKWAPSAVAARVYLSDDDRLGPAIDAVAEGMEQPVPPQEIIRLLDEGGGVALAYVPPAMAYALRFPAETETLLFLPIQCGGSTVGALLVGADGPFSFEARAGLRFVCAQAARALDGVPAAAQLAAPPVAIRPATTFPLPGTGTAAGRRAA